MFGKLNKRRDIRVWDPGWSQKRALLSSLLLEQSLRVVLSGLQWLLEQNRLTI